MEYKIARVFANGGSQAVRLPAEFRFDASDEVYIRRDLVTGELILSSKIPTDTWQSFFALRDQINLAEDFMAARPLNEPLKAPRVDLEE